MKHHAHALKRRYSHRRPSVKVQLERIERLLDQAIARADKRGYTGMVGSKGSLFDEPDVKRLMARRDQLLKLVPASAKRCVKCGDPIADPQLGPDEDERCWRCADF